MQPSELFIGVDVGARELVSACGLQAAPRAIANEAEAIAGWLETLPAGAYIAMESTGRYHGLLAHLAHQRGLRVYVLNARDVFFYARSLGVRGKTDRVDARLIARYLAQHHARLHPWMPPSAPQRQINELLARRAKLARQRNALQQLARGVDLPAVELQALEQAYAQMLEAIDLRVQGLIAADPVLAHDSARLQTITGIGAQTSAMLAVLFNRFRFASADALVAYCGLDPRANDSGSHRGRRRLTKRGPPHLRRLIYLAGLSASRSLALKPLYAALRARGLATTEAFVIIGRKLLRAAFSVWKHGTAFDPARLLASMSIPTPCAKP